jgi:hypothetical protein
MTTQLIRDVMKIVSDQGVVDPVSLHWFDATGCLTDQSEQSQDPLYFSKPPFSRCMVCWEGKSKNHQRMRMWVMVAGDNPEEGIALGLWRQPGGVAPIPSPSMIYMVDGGLIRYGPTDEGVTIDQTEAEMIIGFVSAWYGSLSRRCEAHTPITAQTFTNQRKILQGKAPKYEWRTVMIEPLQARSEGLGGTHASPRQHDRRGHVRRLRSGKNVWVKACKVGDASLGAVFHDYQIKTNKEKA